MMFAIAVKPENWESFSPAEKALYLIRNRQYVEEKPIGSNFVILELPKFEDVVKTASIKFENIGITA